MTETTEPPLETRPDPFLQESQFTVTGAVTNSGVPTPSANSQHNAQSAEQNLVAHKSLTRLLGPDLLRGLIVALQALDHSALIAGAWLHGTAILTEDDGQIVTEWNTRTAWTARMLTHLCAPGFMFLLGMGVVYFSQSRSIKSGWGKARLLKHYFIRAMVLVLVNQLLCLVAGRGQIWVLNIVLLALAVNYFITGVLWVVIDVSETAVANLLQSLRQRDFRSDNGREHEPLLQQDTATQVLSSSAKDMSFHIHNCLLLVLTIVTISWNVWLSPYSGCSIDIAGRQSVCAVVATEAQPLTIFHFLFHNVDGLNHKFISPFPPLAWISFAILGVLYGRLTSHYSRLSPLAMSGLNALAGTALTLCFVATRLFHFGNLSEDCLHMPENLAHPSKNQYLVSFRAFLYVVKYPPSPAFFCYSMAVNFLLLSLFAALPQPNNNKLLPADRQDGNFGIKKITVPLLNIFYATLLPFGQNALFFYVAHLPLYGILGTVAKVFAGRPMGWRDVFTGEPAVGLGNSPAFWVVYFVGLVILWFSCKGYSKFKASRGPDSVFRFF